MSREETQFKPGKTGNPNGRPKKGNSWKDVLAEAMEKEHTVGGETKSLKRIIGDVLSKKALKGDLKAIEMLMDRLEGRPLQGIVAEVTERKSQLAEEIAKLRKDGTGKD